MSERKPRPVPPLPPTVKTLTKPWEVAVTPSPGSLYCVYSEYVEKDVMKSRDPVVGWLANTYSEAIYRCPDFLSEEGRAEYQALREIRQETDLSLWLEKSYLSSRENIDINTRARNVYAGELVFLLSEDDLFYRVLKGDEILLLDKAVFSLLSVRDT